MGVLAYLIPLALILGFAGLLAFVWTIKSGQYDDLVGAAQRVLIDDDEAPKPQGKSHSLNPHQNLGKKTLKK